MIAPLKKGELTELYTWLNSWRLSRPIENIWRDFADGILVAEIIAKRRPELLSHIELATANSKQARLANWNALRNGVFAKLGIALSDETIIGLASAQSHLIEPVLAMLRVRLRIISLASPNAKERGAAPPSPLGKLFGMPAGLNKKLASLPHIKDASRRDVTPKSLRDAWKGKGINQKESKETSKKSDLRESNGEQQQTSIDSPVRQRTTPIAPSPIEQSRKPIIFDSVASVQNRALLNSPTSSPKFSKANTGRRFSKLLPAQNAPSSIKESFAGSPRSSMKESLGGSPPSIVRRSQGDSPQFALKESFAGSPRSSMKESNADSRRDRLQSVPSSIDKAKRRPSQFSSPTSKKQKGLFGNDYVAKSATDTAKAPVARFTATSTANSHSPKKGFSTGQIPRTPALEKGYSETIQALHRELQVKDRRIRELEKLLQLKEMQMQSLSRLARL